MTNSCTTKLVCDRCTRMLWLSISSTCARAVAHIACSCGHVACSCGPHCAQLWPTLRAARVWCRNAGCYYVCIRSMQNLYVFRRYTIYAYITYIHMYTAHRGVPGVKRVHTRHGTLVHTNCMVPGMWKFQSICIWGWCYSAGCCVMV